MSERFYVYFHPKLAILLKFDTYGGSSINGGHFYYNWSPNPNINRGNYTSSGTFISNRDDRFVTMYDDDFNVIDQSKLDVPDDLDVLEHEWEAVKARNAEISEALKKIPYRLVWVGDHDCREGLKLNITNMIDNGKFLTKWKERPFLYLLHHMDNNANHDQITKDRIAMLPDHVREAITPKT